MSFRLSIDKAEGHLIEVSMAMRYRISQAVKSNSPADFSCLKLKMIELETLHDLYESCKEFINNYRYLEDNSHDY